MRIHFPWHKIIECHCVKSYSNQIIRHIIRKLWHCLSVPSSLIKRSNLIWKHVAGLMSGPISLDLSNVCGPDAEFGCSLHWSHNPPFKILEVLEVHMWEVFWFHLFVLNWRQQPAYLCLWDSVSFCLLYLIGEDMLWKTDSSPQKQWSFKNETWGIKSSWELRPWMLAPVMWVLGIVEPLCGLVHTRMHQQHGTAAPRSPHTHWWLFCFATVLVPQPHTSGRDGSDKAALCPLHLHICLVCLPASRS